MYPPQHLGGYELSCLDVTHRWAQRGNEVTVLTSTFRNRPAARDVAGVAVRRDLEWYWRDHAFIRPRPSQRLKIERRNHRRLLAAIEQTNPDVVSVWHLGGLSTALLTTLRDRRIPVVFVICDEWPLYATTVDAWISAWARRPGLAAVAARLLRVPTRLPPLPEVGVLTFVSDYLRRAVAKATGWAVADAPVVPSGLPADVFTPGAAARREWSGRLLCVGRVEPRKGFETAVCALADLPDARLDIVGPADPAHREHLDRVARELGVADRLHFDELPRSELARRYAAADVVLFTSTWNEPFGLVPLEAMACGTPVVATGTGGSAEFLVDRENCLLVAPGDVTELVSAVGTLAGDAGLRQRMTESGLRTASHYTVDRYATTLLALHESVARR